MEDNQTIQHKPSQPEESHPEETSKVISHASNFWAIYYWISFVVLSAISLGVAVYGYNQLFNVGDVPQAKQNTTITIQPTKAPSNSNSLPVWMIIAIALGCATGCLAIFRFFTLSNKVPKFTRNRQRTTKKQISPSNLHHPSPETQPLAGVIPEEETNTIDSNSESLADLLDIRKQTSISSIIQEKE
jgi:hypothetical protein